MSDIPLAGTALRRALSVVDRCSDALLTRLPRPDSAASSGPMPLGVDPQVYVPPEFEAVAAGLEPLDKLIAAVPPGADGMRWRYLDETVLFMCERDVPVTFDEFNRYVDISRVIGLTSGYLGGHTAVLERDETGRPTRQVERSVNRAQPAYLALSGADVLDVCKLEAVRYGKDEHLLRWHQLFSPNASAVRDDGSVSFAPIEGGTRVTIRAYQQLALPPLWRAITPVLWPGFRRALVEDAYRRSFTATLDAIETRASGGGVPTGERVRDAPSVPDALARAAGALIPWRPARPAYTDSVGFRHFNPER